MLSLLLLFHSLQLLQLVSLFLFSVVGTVAGLAVAVGPSFVEASVGDAVAMVFVVVIIGPSVAETGVGVVVVLVAQSVKLLLSLLSLL